MKNPFLEIKEDKEVPAELKNRVMSSVYISKFLGDITELFTSKYIETIEALFNTEQKKRQEREGK